MFKKKTITALSTPYGNSAIAVIRISGKDSINIINKIFKKKNINKQKTHTIHFGYIYEKKNNNRRSININF